MMKTLLTLAFALLVFVPQTFAMDHGKDKMKMEGHKAKAVVFYSDSCGACKILDPKMKEAMQAINTNMIDVVMFDFSSKDTIEATKTLAKEKGVESTLQAYGAKTGFVVLLNHKGEEVGKLTIEDTTAEIAGKVASAILAKS